VRLGSRPSPSFKRRVERREGLEIFLKKGFQKSTQKRYDQSMSSERWSSYVREEGYGDNTALRGLDREVKVELFCYFIKQCYEVHKMSASAVDKLIPAIRASMVCSAKDVKWMEDQAITQARRAVRNISRSAREANMEKEIRRRMPVTVDMVKTCRREYWSGANAIPELDKCIIYIGMMLAFHFMWRASEYILDSSCGTHAVMAEDVFYLTQGGNRRFAWELTRHPFDTVDTVIFVVRSSKADQQGVGRYLYLSRNSATESEMIDDLIKWGKISAVRKGNTFLSRWLNGRNKKLTRRMMSAGLRHIAGLHGFMSIAFAFTLHSLRIGGATAMITSGASRDEVKRVGGWADGSDADLIYHQFAPINIGALSETQFKQFSTAELFNVLPPALARIITEQ
jgi:hypothetical protein